jgi:ribose transport system substrate-binding protein
MNMKKTLATLLCVGATMTATMAVGTNCFAAEDDVWHLGICIHSMDNEYWAQEANAAQLFASQVDNLECDILTCDSDDNKQLQGINDYIAQYGDKAIFVVDPSSTANTANIAETCEESGNYVVILAHRAEGLYPEDYEYFVASLMLSDYDNGYKTAKELIESIGGEGQIAELQGLLGDDSAANRHLGFEAAAAEYENIEVVDTQVANWSQSEAMTITEDWLVNYPDLKAIYSANDTMALGAIEALKNEGKNGEIPVSGCDGTQAAYDAIESGDMYCTIANDGFCIAGYGAAYVYYAATGEYDYLNADPSERMIYCKTTYVDASNVEETVENFITKGDPGYDYSDLEYCIDSYQEAE